MQFLGRSQDDPSDPRVISEWWSSEARVAANRRQLAMTVSVGGDTSRGAEQVRRGPWGGGARSGGPGLRWAGIALTTLQDKHGVDQVVVHGSRGLDVVVEVVRLD